MKVYLLAARMALFGSSSSSRRLDTNLGELYGRVLQAVTFYTR